jgi:hypothetical protein
MQPCRNSWGEHSYDGPLHRPRLHILDSSAAHKAGSLWQTLCDLVVHCRYYSTALELVKRAGPEGAMLARDAVTVPSIMYEVRRRTKS